MKLHVINAVLLLSLTQLSFAEQPPKPASCPSVAAIQAAGVTEFFEGQGVWFGAAHSNNYDTTDKWSFVIGAFQASSEKKAKQQAAKALKSLNLQMGPEAIDVNGQESWVCLYKDKAGHQAATVTPEVPFIYSGLLRK